MVDKIKEGALVSKVKDKFDAIVVGGGISGLLSTLALSKEGKKVLLLEKSSVLGGNCRTYDVDGFKVDTAVHAITHIDDGPVTRLMEKYFDYSPVFLPYGGYFVRDRNGFQEFPWTAQAWVNFKVLPRMDRLSLFQTMASALAIATFDKKSLDMSVYEYLKSYNFSDKTWRFIDTFSYFMSGLSMHETPAWRMLKGARYLDENEAAQFGQKMKGHMNKFLKLVRFHGAYHQGYPRRGIQSITECAIHSFAEKKVEVHMDEEVKKLNLTDGRVSGVTTSKGSYKSDNVIHSGFVKDLPKLLGSGVLPKRFEENLDNLKQSGSLTVWLGLKKPYKAFDYKGSEVWFEDGEPFWAMPTSNFDPYLAPQGKQLVGFSAFAAGDIEAKKKKLLETIHSVYPGLERLVELEHFQHITPPEKAAISCGATFPDQESPIKGLYLVGTDTDYRSMGVTRAAFSVEALLERLKKNKIV
ncbi:MAG: NAD(P)/FAD-dependent oxidoreductase [Candidatus Altiarchaeota archaeon]